MKNSHILLCSNSAWNIVNFRLPLMKYLADQGYRVSAAAPDDEYADMCRAAGFDFFPYHMSRKGTNPLTDLGTYFALKKLYRHVNPDLVCHFTIKPNIYGTIAAAGCGIPAVSNISGLGTVFITHTPVTALVKKLYRYSQKRAAKVFFQNTDDQGQFVQKQLVDAEKTAVLPGSGIDLERFRAEVDGRKRDDVQSTCSFLLVARMLRDKGIREYVEAARIITAERVDARFLLLGPLDTGNRTAISAAELDGWTRSGAVRYLGAVEDVRAHLAGADCVVLPSYREGTPRTLLEAAAMGKPIVATDVPGCRQVVEDGVTGYLCKPYRADSLADAFRRVLMLRPRERYAMGTRGREKMEREYDQRLVFEAYKDAIEKALEAAGKKAVGEMIEKGLEGALQESAGHGEKAVEKPGEKFAGPDEKAAE